MRRFLSVALAISMPFAALAQTGVTQLAQDRAVVPSAESSVPVATKLKKPKARRKSRLAKNRRRVKKAQRLPASIAKAEPIQENLEVFSENTSFEDLVKGKQKAESAANRDPASFAPSARVIAVRRELGLNEAETQVAPQDIILNAGTDNGLEEGMILSVARSIPIMDPYKENQQKQLEVELGQIKVIHAQPTLAVARMEILRPISTGVVVGTRAVLIGDYVGKFSK